MITLLLFVNAILGKQYQELTVFRELEQRNIVQISDTLPDIDSIKWLAYAMNFKKKAAHYKFLEPEVSPVECDFIGFTKYSRSNDTVYYRFNVIKGRQKYMLIDDPVSGIGYSYVSFSYFLINGSFFPRYIKAEEHSKRIKEAEYEFAQFLKSYKGPLSRWLRQECIRRGILSQ